MSCSIPLRNKAKEIVDYTIVSEEDYEELSKYKWCKSNNYVQGNIDNKTWRLHRYIMIKLLGNDITSKIPIDHIDNNRLNNTRDNLRIVTHSENSRNRVKKENTTSKYIGVCFNTTSNKWQSQIKINHKKLNALYENVHHAAHQYNLWCQQYELNMPKLNSIPDELLEDFIQHKPRDNRLPKNITLLKSGKYNVTISGKHIGNYGTLDEAIEVKENTLKEIEAGKLNKILSKPIFRNDDGDCIIEITSKNVKHEMIVDEDNYYELIQYGIVYSHGYAYNRKLGSIHRYVMNYTEDYYIDHINGNRLDNRKSNLRVVTAQENNMNRSVSINSSSKYIGVNLTKSGKYQAKIKNKHLGAFENEIDAAKARDEATKKMYGEFGKLNFPNL